MNPHRDERGYATLETTLMVVILVPLLFGVIEFGWLFQRWLAADMVAVHAARYAGELGGDDQRLRAFIARELKSVQIDPGRVTVEVEPPRVGW
ncbi:MAG: TadE/TadG family type IV pilus assembly protein, partial [Chloroflexota bacterium]